MKKRLKCLLGFISEIRLTTISFDNLFKKVPACAKKILKIIGLVVSLVGLFANRISFVN